MSTKYLTTVDYVMSLLISLSYILVTNLFVVRGGGGGHVAKFCLLNGLCGLGNSFA